MRRLRRSVLLRLSAAGLLVSLGLGLAAPVAAARQGGGVAAWLRLDEVPQATLEAALKAAAGAETPEAYAEALAAALHDALGEAAPPADALLSALYGQLFRVLQEEAGALAVVAAAGSGGAVQAPLEGAAAPPFDPSLRSVAALGVATEPGLLPTPRALRPALQPLGP
ncbi:MAG TPA: hypothetical protein VK002_15275 [Rubricoccaceae bacterium]|nr:hypothetical protein [Rubricoccaceae bacterium]